MSSVDPPVHELVPSLRIHGDSAIPIYLQLKHQLSYLITTSKIVGGAKLPTVRALAAALSINPNTVNQAYRELQAEGLVESYAGRGSFVRKFADASAAEQARLTRLTEVLRDARRKATSLGFDDAAIMQHLEHLASSEVARCHVLFVDRMPHIAAKYAARLEHHVGHRILATALTVDAIETRSARARRALAEAHYVFAFARNVPVLERLLDEAHDIVTIVSEVVPETVRVLRELDPDARVLVLAEELYVHAALNLIANYSPLDANRVPAVVVSDVADVRAAVPGADVVLYTFGVRQLVEQVMLEVPAHELVFDIGPDSVAKLRRMFAVASA